MVIKDGESVFGYRSCRDVEDSRCELASHDVHVRNHEEEALGGSEGSGESSCRRSAVEGACSSRFRLHHRNVHGVSKDVSLAI